MAVAQHAHARQVGTAAAARGGRAGVDRLLVQSLAEELQPADGFRPSHRGLVGHACWSEDGRLLLTASDDCTIKLWDRSRGPREVQLVQSGHTMAVYVAIFMPGTGGQSVVSCSADRQVRAGGHMWCGCACPVPCSCTTVHNSV